jgi:hypothetical protein
MELQVTVEQLAGLGLPDIYVSYLILHRQNTVVWLKWISLCYGNCLDTLRSIGAWILY